MSSTRLIERSSAVYRVLLHVLPASFRRTYGYAMEETFAAAHAAAVTNGRRAVARLYLREAGDVIGTGAGLRLRALRRRWSRGGGGGARGPEPRGRGVFVWLDDARGALRVAARRRASFVFAAGTLGLGIGATTAIFSALKSLVIEPLPFPAAERVVQALRTMPNGMQQLPSGPLLDALSERTDIFEQTVTFGGRRGFRLTGEGEAVSLSGFEASLELPEFMGIAPVLGRTFDRSEVAGRGARVLLLSHGIWQSRYAGAPDVLGQTITLNGDHWTIIGVMPSSAVDPTGVPRVIDVWVPLADEAERQMVARLRLGVTLEVASARVAEVVAQVDPGEGVSGIVLPVNERRGGRLREPLRILTVAAALLLLITCVNVSNLLLHRAAARQQEMAVRSALGAGRARLARQLMFETMLLALTGGALGASLAWLSVQTLNAMRPVDLVELELVRVDLQVLGFALLASLIAGVVFGLVPTVQGARVHALAALGRAPRRGRAVSARFRWTLVGIEVALSFALLVGAVVVLGTLRGLMQTDPGFRPDGVIDVRVSLPGWRYREEPLRRAVFASLMAEMRGVGGVESVSLATGSPPVPMIYMARMRVDGQSPEERPRLLVGAEVDAEFSRTIGVTLLAGRLFTPDDMSGPERPVVLGEAAARALFADGDALGRQFRYFDDTTHTVVGIVRDVAFGLVGTAPGPLALWPLKTVSSRGFHFSRGGDAALQGGMHVLVRARAVSPALMRDLAGIVRRVEPDALVRAEPLSDQLRATIARERLTTSLLATFAGLALVLSAIGLYGVLAQIVTHRRYEIGVRLSLGADASRIRGMVLRSGLLAVGAGLACGGALALAGHRLLGSQIFGLANVNAGAFAIAAVIVTAVALLAMWLPAERAARVNPLVSLRAE